jgi:tetratricopeptide (TPR) repeat protein
LELAPEYFSAKRGTIECLIALELYEDAREMLYRLLVDYPQSMFAISGFGLVNERLKEIYTEKHAEDPTDVEVLVNLVKFNLSLGDEELDEAYNLLIANPQISTHKRYPAFMGECLMHRANYAEAIEYFKDAINREEYYRSYARLVATLIQNNNHEDALAYARIGLTLPDCADNDRSNKARLHVFIGNALTHKGYFDDALEAYAQAEKIQPFLPRLHYDKAVTLKKLHRYAEAVDACEHALQLLSFDADPYCLAMEMYYDADRYDDVLTWAERAANMEIEHSKITYYKGCSLRLLKRESEALECLLSLEDIEYQSYDISKGLVLSEIAFIYSDKELKNPHKCLDYIKRAIEIDSKADYPNWRFLYLNASIHLHSKEGNYQEEILKATNLALAVYNHRNKKSDDWGKPSRPYILLSRGMANFELGNYNDALHDLKAVMGDIKTITEVTVILSDILWRLGFISEHFKDADSALKYYKSAFKMNPDCGIALLGIADVYFHHKRDYASALEIYTLFVETRSDFEVNERYARALLGRAHCLRHLKKWFAYRKRYNEAIKILNQVNQECDEVWIYVHLAEAYHGLKKFSIAEKYIALAKALAKENGETFSLPSIFSNSKNYEL